MLRAHPVKHAFLPICTEPGQLDGLLADPEINVVGVELLAEVVDHPSSTPL